MIFDKEFRLIFHNCLLQLVLCIVLEQCYYIFSDPLFTIVSGILKMITTSGTVTIIIIVLFKKVWILCASFIISTKIHGW